MAEEKIQFNIGAVFAGNNIAAAEKGIKKLGQTTQQAAGVAQQMTTAIGGTNTALGKAIGPASSLIGAFMNGGPVMAAFAGAMTLVNTAIAESQRKAKEAEEAFTRFHDALKGARDANVAAQFAEVKASISSVASESARASAQLQTMVQIANALDAAQKSLNAAIGAGGIADLNLQKLQAVADQITEEGKKVVAAEFDYIAAEKKRAAVVEANAAAIDAARQKIDEADAARAISEDKLNAAREALAAAEANAADVSALSVEKRAAAEAMVETARTQLTAAENELKLKTVAVSVARTNLATATTTAATNEATASAAVVTAEQALAAATAEKANKEAVAALQEELVFASNEQRAAAIKILTERLAAGATQEEAHAAALASYDEANAAAAQATKDRALLAQRGHEYALAYDEAIKQGFTGQEAYNKAIADANAKIEKMGAEAEKNAEVLANPGEKLGEAIGKSITFGNTPMKVEIDGSSVADAIRKGNDELEQQVMNWGTQEHDARVAENQRFNLVQQKLQSIASGDFDAPWVKALAGWYAGNGGAEQMKSDMARATKNLWTTKDKERVTKATESLATMIKSMSTAK